MHIKCKVAAIMVSGVSVHSNAITGGNYVSAIAGHCAIGWGYPDNTYNGCLGDTAHVFSLYPNNDGSICSQNWFPDAQSVYWQVDFDVNRSDVGTSPSGWIKTRITKPNGTGTAYLKSYLISRNPDGSVYRSNYCTVSATGVAQCNYGATAIPAGGTLSAVTEFYAKSTDSSTVTACLIPNAAG